MTSADFLLNSITQPPLGWGAYHMFFALTGEKGFDQWGALTRSKHPFVDNPEPDFDRIKAELLTSTSLSSGVLRVEFANLHYNLFGQPHASTRTDKSEPSILLVHRILGETLYDLFEKRGAEAWSDLAGFKQKMFDDLMLQLKLSKEEGHATDFVHTGNIMIRDASQRGPKLNIIDLSYYAGLTDCFENRPELLIRLFFPELENQDTQKAIDAREVLLHKLVKAAKNAGMGTSNSAHEIEEVLQYSAENYDAPPPSCLTAEQRKETASMLSQLPLVVTMSDVPDMVLPKELQDLGTFSLQDSAIKLRQWLNDIHRSGVGRGLRD